MASLLDQPEEHCELFPHKVCHHKTILVPRLKPAHECTVVPTEICHVKHINARLERVPFKSLWCQDNEEEVETFEDLKPTVEELPGYEPEKSTEIPGYEYPTPSNPLQPPTTTISTTEEDNSFPPDLFELPEVDIDVPVTQEVVTRPP